MFLLFFKYCLLIASNSLTLPGQKEGMLHLQPKLTVIPIHHSGRMSSAVFCATMTKQHIHGDV